MSGRFRALRSLWRIRSYLGRYRLQMTVMVVAAVVGVVASLIVPLVTEAVINGPIAHHQLGGLWGLGGLAIGLGVAQATMIFTRRWIQASAVTGIETSIRSDLFGHLQRLPVAFHDQWQSGQLLSRATVDLSTIRRFLGFGLIYLFVNGFQVIVVVVLLIGLDLPLGLIVAASVVPIVWLSQRFERGYIKVSRRVQDQQGDLTTVVEEAAAGIRVIKAFGRRHHVYGRFDEGAKTLYGTSMDKVGLTAKFWSVLELIPNLVMVLVVLLGALAVGQHSLTLGGLVAFATLFLQLQWPVESVGYILASGQEALTAADRIYEVFDVTPTILGGAEDLARASGRLRFEGVSFRYPGSDREVLHDVWLDVAPGETVALVGATGSGKTTLVGLVPRLYDVTGGRVTLDGVDIRDLELPTLRQLVATAFEDPTLFSASARENVMLGSPDASDQAVASALATAQADFVYDLPWGLATRIGEQGLSLSGGQRQRLALARAIVGRPRVLVLDDTLTALDVHTEAKVEEALRRVLGGTTGLVVAHRPSTIVLAQRVALLDQGTITHVGTHSRLMAEVPTYRAILAQEVEEQPAASVEQVS
ncbi:MAG: ABC transporter ATP-binding protein [Candidatus Dormibacteria bacterium]